MARRPNANSSSLCAADKVDDDWFAGQIIAAMLGSDPNSTQRDNNSQLCSMDEPKLANMAKTAYQAANAMMQVRAADQNKG